MKYVEANVPDGYSVRVYYETRYRNHRETTINTSAKWVTRALILDPNGDVVANGVSICSEKDRACRAIGRAIAVGRAVKYLFEVTALYTPDLRRAAKC